MPLPLPILPANSPSALQALSSSSSCFSGPPSSPSPLIPAPKAITQLRGFGFSLCLCLGRWTIRIRNPRRRARQHRRAGQCPGFRLGRRPICSQPSSGAFRPARSSNYRPLAAQRENLPWTLIPLRLGHSLCQPDSPGSTVSIYGGRPPTLPTHPYDSPVRVWVPRTAVCCSPAVSKELMVA